MQQCGTVILFNVNHRFLPSSHSASHKKSNISLFPKYDRPLPSFLPVYHFSCNVRTVSLWRSLRVTFFTQALLLSSRVFYTNSSSLLSVAFRDLDYPSLRMLTGRILHPRAMLMGIWESGIGDGVVQLGLGLILWVLVILILLGWSTLRETHGER